MPKPKLNVKELLLKKGEFIALGVAGIGLVLLLLWGVVTGLGAENPSEISKDLTSKATQVQNIIVTGQGEPDPLPEWAQDKKTPGKPGPKTDPYPKVPINEFAVTNPMFDPVGRPDTKRELPIVLGVEEYQVDLIRAPMKGYDIVYDNEGNAKIAVRTMKQIASQDKSKVDAVLKAVKTKGTQGAKARQQVLKTAPPPQPGVGMPGPGMPGPGMPGPGMPGPGMPGPGMPGPGMPGPGRGMPGPGMPGPGSSSSPYGFGEGAGGSFDPGGQRTEFAIEYIPIEDVDKVMASSKYPAMGVIPLRMAVIHATYPLRRQLEEVKRAMRLRHWTEAYPYVRFDGFDVKRKVKRVLPGGKEEVVQDWADYKYEERYIELIGARKMNDYFDVDPKKPGSEYLPYFLRYEEAMAMPLPELVPELGTYPDLRLKPINETIKKLVEASTPKVEASDLAKRLQGKQGKKDGMFIPQTAGGTGAGAFYGQGSFSGPYVEGGPGPGRPGPGMPGPGMPGPGMPGPGRPGPGPGPGFAPGAGPGPMGVGPGGVPNPNDPNAAQPVEIDHMLVRFVDCDVRPGYTYEYQIRVRMENPNFGSPKEYVQNPAWVTDKYRILNGPWVQLRESLNVPAESFLFAVDPATYRQQIEAAYPPKGGAKALHDRLQVKENQAVVEVQTWLEQIRMESGKREPIGGWVVADIPVGRGEYIGKKTYVKLPLWSSEFQAYVLRNLPEAVVRKSTEQPKGWLVDFSTKSVLVDFEGGQVRTQAAGNRSYTEDVATEVLIVRPDGKLLVRNSAADEGDAVRKQNLATWENWLKVVEQRGSTPGTPGGSGNPFERPGAGPGPGSP